MPLKEMTIWGMRQAIRYLMSGFLYEGEIEVNQPSELVVTITSSLRPMYAEVEEFAVGPHLDFNAGVAHLRQLNPKIQVTIKWPSGTSQMIRAAGDVKRGR